jgi:hypothetical protein
MRTIPLLVLISILIVSAFAGCPSKPMETGFT